MTYPAALAAFVSGLITMGYLVAGLFFLRFWRRTRDRLFAIFAVAFWLLAINFAAFPLFGEPLREAGWVYLIRLAAFCLIIGTIVAKNLASGDDPASVDRHRSQAATAEISPPDSDP